MIVKTLVQGEKTSFNLIWNDLLFFLKKVNFGSFMKMF